MAQSSECCIFIDNSNLFIEGQKFFARAKGLRLTVAHDIRFRIDIGRLVEVLAGNRKITYAKLYGSEPPANDSLWKRIRSKGVEVDTFQRNAKDMEKQLDTALASDVAERAVLSSRESSAQTSMTFIIIGGDRDYLPPYEKVLKYRLNLEVAAWKNCLSQEVKKYIEKKLDSSHLLSLDDIAIIQNPPVYYLADEWPGTKPLPRERTIVFEFAFDIIAGDAKYLNTEVTELIKLPCWYLQQNPRHLMIIIIPNENSGKYSTCRLLEDICNHVRQSERFRKNIKQVVDYVKFKQDQNDPELFERKIYLNHKFYAEEDNEEDLDDSEGFEVVGPTRKHKTYQKYSEKCPFQFACRLGKRCHFEHSPEEKEHFTTPSNVGKLYKSKYCLYAQNGRCKFKNDSNKCCFAHSSSEARCYNCQPGGLVGDHWMDECKLKKF